VAYGPAQAFPPQPPVPEGFGAFGGSGVGVAGVNPTWLAASADRERAVGVLRAGFTEGRLTQDELDDRVARAYAARTYGQLWELTSDLPVGALPYPQFPHGQAVMVTPEATPPASRSAGSRRSGPPWPRRRSQNGPRCPCPHGPNWSRPRCQGAGSSTLSIIAPLARAWV